MIAQLEGCKVAILVTEGFEQSELTEPKKALESAGARTSIVSPAKGEVQGWKHFDKGAGAIADGPDGPEGCLRSFVRGTISYGVVG